MFERNVCDTTITTSNNRQRVGVEGAKEAIFMTKKRKIPRSDL